jgi:putative transposase
MVARPAALNSRWTSNSAFTTPDDASRTSPLKCLKLWAQVCGASAFTTQRAPYLTRTIGQRAVAGAKTRPRNATQAAADTPTLVTRRRMPRRRTSQTRLSSATSSPSLGGLPEPLPLENEPHALLTSLTRSDPAPELPRMPIDRIVLNQMSMASAQHHAPRQRVSRRSVATQLVLAFPTWGGARRGAGRPPKGARAGVSHLRRHAHAARHPLHVTLKLVDGVESLRGSKLFPEVRAALAAGKQRSGFRLVHFSVQRDHVHLIAEAQDRRALARGVQGLSIRLARTVNRRLGRRGRLFADRYHSRALKTPREVRLALRYVFGNVKKHGSTHDGGARSVPFGFVDPCSSAAWSAGFSRPQGLAFGSRRAREDWTRRSGATEPPVVEPHSWLLRVGHCRAGPLDIDHAPSGEYL